MNMQCFDEEMAGGANRAAVDSSAPMLRIENLNVSRHGVALLRDISLTLARGTTLGLVGESGAGKSMLGRVLARNLPAGFSTDARRLEFAGEDLLQMTAAAHRELLTRRIAFIPQEPMSALDPTLSIGRQFALHLARFGVPASQRQAKTIEALKEVLLPEPARLLERFPFQLSGGQCQRVMIALAFASDPDLVISDEATTALDVTTQRHIVELMRKMQAKRVTSVIFVTHDLGLALHACDEVAVLYAGDVVEIGPTRRVVNAPAHPYTRALLMANPPLFGPRLRVVPLAGHMPGFEAFSGLQGCRFVTRCAHVHADCSRRLVPLVPVGRRDPYRAATGAVRCVLAHRDEAEVPLTRSLLPELPPMSEAPFLQLRGVAKRYVSEAGFGRVKTVHTALERIDLAIAPGEFLGVVGESGSGKSTLGRLVMGLDAPTEGEILLDGEALGPGRADWRKRVDAIQMIFQDARSALNPRRKVSNIVTQSMESRANLHSDRSRRALNLLQEVGLAPMMGSRFPSQLSGGQRQRVNIARAICEVPRLLVADEIVSGLDVSVQAQIMELLLALRASHKIALMLISHDLAVVRYLCTRVIVIQNGVVVESGPTEAVLTNPMHPYTQSLIAAAPQITPIAN